MNLIKFQFYRNGTAYGEFFLETEDFALGHWEEKLQWMHEPIGRVERKFIGCRRAP